MFDWSQPSLKVKSFRWPTKMNPSVKLSELRRSMFCVVSHCWESSWLTFSRLDWLTQNTWIPPRWANCKVCPIGLGGSHLCFSIRNSWRFFRCYLGLAPFWFGSEAAKQGENQRGCTTGGCSGCCYWGWLTPICFGSATFSFFIASVEWSFTGYAD